MFPPSRSLSHRSPGAWRTFGLSPLLNRYLTVASVRSPGPLSSASPLGVPRWCHRSLSADQSGVVDMANQLSSLYDTAGRRSTADQQGPDLRKSARPVCAGAIGDRPKTSFALEMSFGVTSPLIKAASRPSASSMVVSDPVRRRRLPAPDNQTQAPPCTSTELRPHPARQRRLLTADLLRVEGTSLVNRGGGRHRPPPEPHAGTVTRPRMPGVDIGDSFTRMGVLPPLLCPVRPRRTGAAQRSAPEVSAAERDLLCPPPSAVLPSPASPSSSSSPPSPQQLLPRHPPGWTQG